MQTQARDITFQLSVDLQDDAMRLAEKNGEKSIEGLARRLLLTNIAAMRAQVKLDMLKEQIVIGELEAVGLGNNHATAEADKP